jgi:hypothetical protein
VSVKVPTILGWSKPPARFLYKPMGLVLLNVGEPIAYRCTDGSGTLEGVVASIVEQHEETGHPAYWLDFSLRQLRLFAGKEDGDGDAGKD